jgi:hypothetical protein
MGFIKVGHRRRSDTDAGRTRTQVGHPLGNCKSVTLRSKQQYRTTFKALYVDSFITELRAFFQENSYFRAHICTLHTDLYEIPGKAYTLSQQNICSTACGEQQKNFNTLFLFDHKTIITIYNTKCDFHGIRSRMLFHTTINVEFNTRTIRTLSINKSCEHFNNNVFGF